jgi:hypothetical protein
VSLSLLAFLARCFEKGEKGEAWQYVPKSKSPCEILTNGLYANVKGKSRTQVFAPSHLSSKKKRKQKTLTNYRTQLKLSK